MVQEKIKILFFGTPEFSLNSLKKLHENQNFEILGVVTQPDKPAGRGQDLKSSPVKLFALEKNIPIFQPKKLKGNEESFIREISALGEIDFGVVIAFGQILPQQILDYPKFGCVNVHASLLPRWRGAAPIQRALLAGDKQTGICIMKMDAGLDTGDVYSSDTLDISDDESTKSLHDKLAQSGSELLVTTLLKVAKSEIKALRQSDHGVSYAEKISNLDLLINWQDGADLILRKIKTFSPKPGAYTFLEGKRLKVLKAKILGINQGSEAGKITETTENSIIVQTGNSVLEILELQLEGKKAMLTSEFLKGYNKLNGTKLGS